MRRLRAILIIALLWAIVWAPLGALLYYLSGPQEFVNSAPTTGIVGQVLRGGAIWAVFGALNGAIFAAVLALAERSRSFGDLTTRRVMFWGALGSLPLPLILAAAGALAFGFDVWSVVILPIATIAALGAGCAAVTLSLARRAPVLSSAERGSLTSA